MNFEQALNLAGLLPGDIVADGKRRRCRTKDKPLHKNGVYKLALGGRIGWYRNYALDGEDNVWQSDDATPAKPIDPALLQRQRDEARARRVAGTIAARELWAAGKPFRGHPYIESQALSAQGCAGLRVWRGSVWVDDGNVSGDWLLVPMYFNGTLVNLQRISPTGIKRQMPGALQVGAYCSLVRERAAITVFAEGFATGLAVYQSMRFATVHVAFNADNLLPVVQGIKPTGSVVLAADNDHKTLARRGFNPGIDKARNAADLIGCGVAYPSGIEGSDFADMLREIGTGAAKKIERLLLANAKYVMT